MEAYGSAFLAILAVELPVTWWLKAAFWLFAAGLLTDISWRSPWTTHLGRYRWLINSSCLAALALVAVPLVHKQFVEDGAGALEGKLNNCSFWFLGCGEPGPRMLQFGDAGGTIIYNGQLETQAMELTYDAGIQVDEGPHGPELTTEIRDKDANLVVKIEKNRWTVYPPFCLDKNYTKNTLEVRDHRGHVVLWTRLLKDRVQIQGEWRDEHGHGRRWHRCPAPRDACIELWDNSQEELRAEYLIDPMFEYPSKEHWGEARKVWPVHP